MAGILDKIDEWRSRHGGGAGARWLNSGIGVGPAGPVDLAAEEASKIPDVPILEQLGIGRVPEGYYNPEQIKARQEEQVSPAVPAGANALSPTSENYLTKLHDLSMAAIRDPFVKKKAKTAAEVAMGIPDADYDALMKEHPHLLARDENGSRVIVQPKTDKQYEKMSDKEFKKAVGDVNTGPAGMGYVELTDKKGNPLKGKAARMERVINQKGIGDEDIDLSNLNAKEVTALAHLRSSQHGQELSQQRVEELRMQNKLLNANRADTLEQKTVDSWFKNNGIKTKIKDENGNETTATHATASLFDAWDKGLANVPKTLQVDVKNAGSRYLAWAKNIADNPTQPILDYMKKKKATMDEVLASESGQRALRRIYMESLTKG